MTPSEYIELTIMAGDSVGQHAANAVAIFSAYAIAMYLACSTLTRFQLSLLSVLYSIFFFAPANAAIDSLKQIEILGNSFAREHPAAVAKRARSGRRNLSFLSAAC
ncbi:MAG: hypothetical protein AAGG11_15925 [Pseudomonadota bacterium]